MATATSPIEITLPRLFPRQEQIINHPARFKVVVCGRRWGKTQLAAWEALRRALMGGVVWWVAPTSDTTRRGENKIEPLAMRIPGVKIHRAIREIHFPGHLGGGMIAFKTSSSGVGLLGDGLDYVIIDEAALVRETAWMQELRPSLADHRGGAMFISTPRGRNWFWRAYMMGLDDSRPDWYSWTFPTSTNPIIAASEIEDARQLLPQRIFEQEFLAKFLEDGGAVFRGIDACIVEPTPQPGARYVFGVDWGRENDYTAVAVMDIATHQVVEVDRFNQIGWALQRGRLRALYEKWQPVNILAEANSIGGPNIEALQMEGLPVNGFTTSASSKGPLIESLALAFEQQQISIPNDPLLVGELQAYSMERLSSGRYQYSAPQGMHDDMVIALALVWEAGLYGASGISFS